MDEEWATVSVPADNMVIFDAGVSQQGLAGETVVPKEVGDGEWKKKTINVPQVFLNENKMCMKVERTIYPQEEVVSQACSHTFKECSYNLWLDITDILHCTDRTLKLFWREHCCIVAANPRKLSLLELKFQMSHELEFQSVQNVMDVHIIEHLQS